MSEKIKFIRFGGLSPIKQHRYTANEAEMGFHFPPAKYGFYAFHEKYVEFFLLGATYHPYRDYAKGEWIKDDEGNLIKENDVYLDYDAKTDKLIYVDWFTKLLKRRGIKSNIVWSCSKKEVSCKRKMEDDFEYDECDTCENDDLCHTKYMVRIKEPKTFEHTGELWHHLPAKPGEILATKGTWVKSTYDDYVKILNRHRHDTLKDAHKHGTSEAWDDWKMKMRAIDPFRKSPTWTYCKDELEVFIEKVK